MDEDEIEMLQEARARLANTQGKKAKRKQREKMLSEAKRLAELQKRRELKQAGLISSAFRTRRKRSKKGRREIDYGVEIPFHKPAPAGFHSVSEEKDKSEDIRVKRLKNANYRRINENQYKSRDREAALAKKREEARLRTLDRANQALAEAKAAAEKKQDTSWAQKRGALSLPEPMVTDAELEHAAKSDSSLMPPPDIRGPTDTLLGDYTDRPLPTPMRTPVSNQKVTTRESVLREASNLRMLEHGETPLLGGENPQLQSDDASTATPRINLDDSSSTPLQRQQFNQTPSTIATRDELGLNRGNSDDASIASTFYTAPTLSAKEIAREERRAAKRARRELEEALASLPTPQFEYELAVPTVSEEENDVTPHIEKDAADIEKEEIERLQKEAAKLYEARSTVLKREELPRPPNNPKSFDLLSQYVTNDAQSLILQETFKLIQYDTHAHPITPPLEDIPLEKKKRKSKKRSHSKVDTVLDYIPEDALDDAKRLLQEETELLMEDANIEMNTDTETNAMVLSQNKKEIEWTTTPQNESSSQKLTYETLYPIYNSLLKKNSKLQSKLQLKNGGYPNRTNALLDTIKQCHSESIHKGIEMDVFEMLMRQEEVGIDKRLGGIEREVEDLQRREVEGQKEYGDLLHELNRYIAMSSDK